MQALASCEFKLQKVNEITVAGIKINTSGATNLNFADAIKLANALSTKKIPVGLDFDLNGKNPNKIDAQMSRFDWKLKLKGEEVINGTINNGLKIPAISNSDFNFNTSVDVYSIVSKYSLDELKSMLNNAFDEQGNPKDLKFYIKPYLVVGKVNIPYPGFIEIAKYYKSN